MSNSGQLGICSSEKLKNIFIRVLTSGFKLAY